MALSATKLGDHPMNFHSRLAIAALFVVTLGVLGLGGCGGGGGGGGDAAAPAPITTTTVALPETGQTTCSFLGAVALCAGTGQDGELRAGVAWPNPRFVAGSGATTNCVSDNLTGLMWMRGPNAISANWTTALTNANDLLLCGFSDWRLPNRKELQPYQLRRGGQRRLAEHSGLHQRADWLLLDVVEQCRWCE